MTNFIPSTDKLEVFEALLKARKSSYALQDKGLISDDSVVAQEENALMKAGIDYEEYTDWKDETAEYPVAIDVIKKMFESKDSGILGNTENMDDFVYEAISEWDIFFTDDEEWCDTSEDCETTDVKDSLRDEVLNLIDENGFDLEKLTAVAV